MTSFEIDRITKRFGDIVANDAVTFEIAPGEIFGLLGPNGAGKSTLVRSAIGLVQPDSGAIRLGADVLTDDTSAARRLCSYLPQAAMPIDSFRVREAIELGGRIRGGPRPEVRRRTAELIEALALDDWADAVGATLSGGVRRLVGFAMVAVWPAPVVILDEPTNDVDPLRRRYLWDAIRRLSDTGARILLVTHNVLEAERAVDRLGVMRSGRIVASGTPASLKLVERGSMRLEIRLLPGALSPLDPLPEFAAASAVTVRDRCFVSVADQEVRAAIDWAQTLADAGAIEEYSIAPESLEDVYVRLIDGPATAAPAAVARQP